MSKRIDCEICHEPIDDNMCFMIDPFNHRAAHKRCIRQKLMSAFSDTIGTDDDEIDELITEAIIDHMEEHTPSTSGNWWEDDDG